MVMWLTGVSDHMILVTEIQPEWESFSRAIFKSAVQCSEVPFINVYS